MCSPKTMLKIALWIGIPFGLGLLIFPQFRASLAGLAPFAIVAICPLAMIFGMRGMGLGGGKEKGCGSATCDYNHQTSEKSS